MFLSTFTLTLPHFDISPYFTLTFCNKLLSNFTHIYYRRHVFCCKWRLPPSKKARPMPLQHINKVMYPNHGSGNLGTFPHCNVDMVRVVPHDLHVELRLSMQQVVNIDMSVMVVLHLFHRPLAREYFILKGRKWRVSGKEDMPTSRQHRSL